MGYPSDEDELWDDIGRWCKMALKKHFTEFGVTMYPTDDGWCVRLGLMAQFKDERRSDAVRQAAQWCRENVKG